VITADGDADDNAVEAAEGSDDAMGDGEAVELGAASAVHAVIAIVIDRRPTTRPCDAQLRAGDKSVDTVRIVIHGG
jgi:hypothetical protein